MSSNVFVAFKKRNRKRTQMIKFMFFNLRQQQNAIFSVIQQIEWNTETEDSALQGHIDRLAGFKIFRRGVLS